MVRAGTAIALIERDSIFIDVALGLAALGFVGTIALASAAYRVRIPMRQAIRDDLAGAAKQIDPSMDDKDRDHV